ncbi:MAG: hypothetical protein AUF76_19195 [Acidobacteria bacterium 13_1_20CM_2_65_9]|nr:MAG: hypothetical protein AUF76_19195 [Acidobacteria bacterium 13_1_20CM_2_65_9]
MTSSPSRLERLIGAVLRAGVTASSICLGAGLVLALIGGGEAIANVLLHTGIVVLLATPVARVLVSIVEYAQQRDWTFTLLTAIVLVELLASAVAALIFNKRL